ncbi:MAG: UbiD family decarboxylase [Deltaproteobacteria bacterium]|nr:UbiD family decarboxylase [Deltaproteobacteria bacterium]
MGYASLQACVDDLRRTGHLLEIKADVDPHLEVAEIQRRVYRAGGPALLFTRARGSNFPLLGNLFGTMARAEFIFRDALDPVRRLVELKVDPASAMKRPWRHAGALRSAWYLRPKFVDGGPVFAAQSRITDLPKIVCWPDDGGPFITLPQVYTEDPTRPGFMASNLGMYRIQLQGNDYVPDEEVGLHYQLHRGIGVHHTAALARGESLKVAIFVGGPPAMTLAAVMPLPEGLSELGFAGVLGRRRVRMAPHKGAIPVAAEADFVILGEIAPGAGKPEGPFGDHLGYYSLRHNFPVLRVLRVYHRRDAIWPFTVVGRPPQEDTVFGELIHSITGPIIPTVLPGIRAVHAVDAAGVHPLLLAVGSERYVPYDKISEPRELLTQANAILGQGQLSLAKYLFIAADSNTPTPDIHNVGAFLQHVLERLDPTRDLHFHTRTTMDTLDYSGSGFNRGSKLVLAAVGPPARTLPESVPSDLTLPPGFSDARVAMPGVLVVRGPSVSDVHSGTAARERFCTAFSTESSINRFALVVVVDDAEFVARSIDNFVWTTFTRSNPAADIGGIGAFVEDKHWGCRGAIVIDARRKPHHAPPLVEDARVTARVDSLFASGGPLHGIE